MAGLKKWSVMTYGKVFSNDFCSDNALKKKKLKTMLQGWCQIF